MTGTVPDGTGLLLQPAGLDVLTQLRLLEPAMKRGRAIDRVISRSRKGAMLMELRYADLRPELWALGIRRATLAGLLLDAARAAGCTVRSGAPITGLKEDFAQVSLNERDGTAHGEFDCALVCDGLNSRLRQQVAPVARVAVHEHGVFSVVAPLPAALSGGALLQRLDGMRDAIGLLPIGRDAEAIELVSFFWNARAADVPALKAAGYPAWCEYIGGFAPEAREVLRHAGRFEALTFSTTADVTMRRWHGARTVVLGDAAHALNPLLGLGATMALLDAASLCRCLSESPQDIGAAFANYQAQRAPQLAPYARVSRLWSRLDASGFSGLRRRLFLVAARGMPFVRRRLVKHMCGYARHP